jgi:hypothetical protein
MTKYPFVYFYVVINEFWQGPRRRVEIQNCQTWLKDVVAALVQSGLIHESAIQIISDAPKN